MDLGDPDTRRSIFPVAAFPTGRTLTGSFYGDCYIFSGETGGNAKQPAFLTVVTLREGKLYRGITLAAERSQCHSMIGNGWGCLFLFNHRLFLLACSSK
jgi:hypothetical protein